MNTTKAKVEEQVHFWALLGPFAILLSIAVLLFKISTHWYFPISALIGIPLCVKWKVKGLAAALFCLITLFIINFQNLNLDERYWHIGMGLAVAFSFIILTLSIEEVQSLVTKFQLESQSRLDNFLHLDEKFVHAEKEWASVKEKAESEILALSQSLAKVEEDKQTFFKLAQLAKEELIIVRNQFQNIYQELNYKKQQLIQLSERFEESEIMVQSFVNSNSEMTIKKLTSEKELLEQQKENFKSQILTISENNEIILERLRLSEEQMKHQHDVEHALKCALNETKLRQEEENQRFAQRLHEVQLNAQNHLLNLQTLETSLEKIQSQLKEKEERIKVFEINELELKSHCQEAQHLAKSRAEEINSLNTLNRSMQTQMESLENERHSLVEKVVQLENAPKFISLPSSSNTRKMEAMYLQLREQFEDKTRILALTRQELFYANEKIALMQKEKDEFTIFGLSPVEDALFQHLLKCETKFIDREKELKEENQLLNEIVDQLLIYKR